MRSALYYPFTSIESEGLIRSSLLLWDELHVMVPWDGFAVGSTEKDHARALELISVAHVPSDEEKQQAHDFIEDFATRPLPEAFGYDVKAVRGDWRIYTEKLLPQTWEILRSVGLAGRENIGGSGTPVAEPTGISLLTLLADCCAGDTLARITDQSAPYGILTGLLGEKHPTEDDQREAEDRLVAITLAALDLRKIPLTKLIAFREREEKSAKGYDLRALRHRYLDRLSNQARELVLLRKAADRAELARQFEQTMSDDLRDLRSELGIAAKETIFSKETVVAGVAAIGAVTSAIFNYRLQDVVTPSGGAVSVGGLFALWTKFGKSRRDILKRHPMAYLYELRGGLRI